MDFWYWLAMAVGVIGTLWGVWQSKRDKSLTSIILIDQFSFPLVQVNTQLLDKKIFTDYVAPTLSSHYVYRGTLINSGNEDIYRDLILQPICIGVPQDFTIIQAKIGNASDNILPKMRLENGSVFIDWEILKPLEHFSFELIVASDKGFPVYELPRKILINHRIAKVGKIERISQYEMKNSKINFWKELFPTYLFILALWVGVIWSTVRSFQSVGKTSGNVSFHIEDKSFNKPVELEYFSKDSVILKENKVRRIVSVNQLDQVTKIVPDIDIHEVKWIVFILPILLAALCIVVTRVRVRDDLKNIRLQKIRRTLI